MSSRADHVIEVRAVGSDGKVIKKDPLDPSAQSNPLKLEKDQGDVKRAVITSGIQKTAASIFSYGVSNLGRMTGDYVLQDNVQSFLQISGYAAIVIANPVIGSIYIATDLMLRSISESADRIIRNREVELLRMRTGMIGYSGGRSE